MANIVLGIAFSHGGFLHVPVEKLHLVREKDQNDTRFNYAELAAHPRPGIEEEITDERMMKKYDDCMKSLGVLKNTLDKISPDVLVVVGDDQHENLMYDNMPVFCIYRGPSVEVVKRPRSQQSPRGGPGEEEKRRQYGNTMRALSEVGERAPGLKSYACDPELAEHLIRYLVEEGFDVACSNKLKPEIGLGHAFTALYKDIMPDGRIPIVPFMVNTFYPPNQPTPRRCYELGQALTKAIEAWDSDKRVAVVASGGLSHAIIDEDIDRATIDGLQKKDKNKLYSLPVEKLVLGTSENRNWIVMGGALEHLPMQLIDYVPRYRTIAGTGCAMGYAQWI